MVAFGDSVVGGHGDVTGFGESVGIADVAERWWDGREGEFELAERIGIGSVRRVTNDWKSAIPNRSIVRSTGCIDIEKGDGVVGGAEVLVFSGECETFRIAGGGDGF